MEKQEHIHDDHVSLNSDEDEYEYTYVDSDTEEQEDTKRGVKRNASPSFALGQEDASAAARPAVALPTATASPPLQQASCPKCHEETHAPITACDLIEQWNEVTQDESLGILVVKAKYIVPSMKRRIQQAAEILKTSNSEAAVRLRQNGWNVEALTEDAIAARRTRLATIAPRRDEVARRTATMRGFNMFNILDSDDDFDLFRGLMTSQVARVAPPSLVKRSDLPPLEAGSSSDYSLDEDDKKPAAVEITDTAVRNDTEKDTSDDGENADQKLPAVEKPQAMDDSSAEVVNENRERARCNGTETHSDVEGDTKLPAVEDPSAAVVSFGSQEELAVQENKAEADDENLPLVENPQVPAAEAMPAELFCHICMEGSDVLEEKDIMSMSCGHTFCRECWRQFITHMFDNSVLPDECLQTTCPFPECELVVTEEQIEQVAPELLPEYENRQLHSFVEANRQSLRWCAGPDCDNRVAVRSRNGLFPQRIHSSVASCDACQTRFCFGCGQAPHGDGYCDAERGSLLSERKGPMKNCPKCNVRIEKNGGCNHMRCKCGHNFCWICLADMTDYNHYCGRLLDDDEEVRWLRRQARAGTGVNLEYVFEALKKGLVSDDDDISDLFQQKKKMDRIAHYLARFAAHEQGQRFAEDQCEMLLHGRAIDFAKATDLKSATDTDFLAVANKRLVAARRILKYSYCYAYYLPEEESEGMISQKGLFQNHQERLERFTEELSNISEHALTYDDRAKIVNLIGVVDQCMKTILEFEEFGANWHMAGVRDPCSYR